MITKSAALAALRFDDLAQQVGAFLTTAKVAAADGLTWGEFGELMVSLLRISIATMDRVSTLTGAEKKELVLEAVAALFDTVADRAVPLVLWPVWIVAKPAVRSLILSLASGAVEQLLPLVRAI